MTSISEKFKIQRLKNSIHYGLEVAFILLADKTHRLIAINKGRMLIDGHYPTLRGAKIAFSKYTQEGKMTDSANIMPNWSHTYPVEVKWITPYLEICKKV